MDEGIAAKSRYMRFAKLALAVPVVLYAGVPGEIFALNLYMDNKTAQIYAKPGPGRQFIGAFEKIEEAPDQAMASSKHQPHPVEEGRSDPPALQAAEAAQKVHPVEAGKSVQTRLGEQGLEIESSNGDFKMNIGGDVQLDAQLNDNGEGIPQSAQLNDGMGARRTRVHTQGKLSRDFNYRFEYDFVRGSGTGAAGITDAWVEYSGWQPASITVGQFREPFSLESLTNYKYLTFIERSAPNNAFVEFANPFLMGISAQTSGENYTVRGAFQAEPIGNGNFANNTSLTSNGNANRNGQSGNSSYGFTGRATFLPFYDGNTGLLHIGASGSYRNVNNTSNGVAAMSFASWAGNVDRTNWANTGGLTDPVSMAGNRRVLESFSRLGVEVAGVYGPFSLQAEYMRTGLGGQNYDSRDHLDGYYAYASYFLTGESRSYDKKRGAFGRLNPGRNFDLKNGGPGAWEFAIRFDSLDMNTAHVSGGFMQTGTLALNWYLNPYFRLMADYAHVFTNQHSDNGFTKVMPALATAGQHPGIFTARAQVEW